MKFNPPRFQGLLLGSLILVLLLVLSGFGIYQLTSGSISPLLIIWVLLPMLGLPLFILVGYRMYTLAVGYYWIDRDGVNISWGWSKEQIPLASITAVYSGDDFSEGLHPGLGLWWPGCMIGKRTYPEIGKVEFLAASGKDGMIVLTVNERSFAISPSPVDAFRKAFVDATRMGSLEPIEHHSSRPDFISTTLWFDLRSRWLIITGLVLQLSSLGFLGLQIPSLPDTVPFGFNALGQPVSPVPPTRLLLLPLMGGFFWFTDLLIGAWLYRRKKDQPIAYSLWAGAIFIGILIWVAVIQLLRFKI
jgi:hypothetical protein